MLKRSILSMSLLLSTQSIAYASNVEALLCHFGEQEIGLIFATGSDQKKGFINEFPVEVMYLNDGVTLVDANAQTMVLIKEMRDRILAEGLFRGRVVNGGCLDFGEQLLATTELLLPAIVDELTNQSGQLKLKLEEKKAVINGLTAAVDEASTELELAKARVDELEGLSAAVILANEEANRQCGEKENTLTAQVEALSAENSRLERSRNTLRGWVAELEKKSECN
ncbi:hypothetical protein [uncultured Shimia sp.]|uniref:hypothetical protein n=1 Tax=uncultured Shimia sp. TaxID=573152 RepID=UPI002631EAEB|nr:hypothetical protein [uncultured Shimia sp.]